VALVLLALSLPCGCRGIAGYGPAPRSDGAADAIGEGKDAPPLEVAIVDGSLPSEGSLPPSFSCKDYPAGYGYALPLAVDTKRVSGSHTDYTLLVVLEHAALENAHKDGLDVRFRDEAGAPLAHEIEAFRSKPSPRLIAYVSISALASDGIGPRLCAYFGKPNVTPLPDATAASVWKGYAGVFHFAAEPFVDSSPWAIKVTGSATRRSDGAIGTSLQLDATKSQSLRLADRPAVGDAPFSVAVWVRPRQLEAGAWLGLVTKGRESDTEWYGLWARPAGGNTHELSFGWTGFRSCCPWGKGNIDTVERLQPGKWRYLVGTFDGQRQRFYIDGQLVDDQSNSYKNVLKDTVIGLNNPPNEAPAYFDGQLDELRLSKVSRSAEWIATQYQNQLDPQGFVRTLALQCAAGCP
jgi:hypothetical protein